MKRTLLLLTILAALVGVTKAQSHHWTVNSGLPNNMTVTGVIIIDDVTQTATTLEIGGFCGEDCRASGFLGLFPPTGAYVVTLTILGDNNGEEITFKLYDHSAGEELDLDCQSTVTFENNGVIGNAINCYEFTFVTPSIATISAGNWSNGAIWAGGTPPGTGAHVVIDHNCTVDENVTVATLEVDPTAKLTVQAGRKLTVTGELVSTDEDCILIKDTGEIINESSGVKATAEKDITAYTTKDSDGWYLVSSPTNSMAIAGSDFIDNEYDLFRWNETTCTWENYKTGHLDFTTFENGRGYLYANSETFSPAFKGDLGYATMSRTLTCTTKDGMSGVNMIGNPFPHTIYKGEGGAIDNNKLASGYYTLSFKGAWETKSFDDPIKPGQGFVVVATETLSLEIEKTTAESTDESGAKKGIANRMKMTMTNGDVEDRAFVYFSDGIGLEKLGNLSTSIPTISVKSDDKEYAIAHMDTDTDTIDVLFWNTLAGDFTLSFEFMNVDFEDIYLLDNFNGEVTNLNITPSYTFHANGDEAENRFTVIARGIDGIGEQTGNALFAYATMGGIMVTGYGMLEVFDMTGRMVGREEVSGSSLVCNGIATGVYVMRLVNGERVNTQRIVIK
ncbi:MAG: T9SS type A sorting domain-containing protein [Bacteroidales bacterium]|nr:T9SS type A sorting domain-containing protein [Bacteroidales bacterium]